MCTPRSDTGSHPTIKLEDELTLEVEGVTRTARHTATLNQLNLTPGPILFKAVSGNDWTPAAVSCGRGCVDNKKVSGSFKNN